MEAADHPRQTFTRQLQHRETEWAADLWPLSRKVMRIFNTEMFFGVAHLPRYSNFTKEKENTTVTPALIISVVYSLTECLDPCWAIYWSEAPSYPIICYVCKRLIKSDRQAREMWAWRACSCVTSQTNLSYWQVLRSKNTTLGHYQTSTQCRLTLSWTLELPYINRRKINESSFFCSSLSVNTNMSLIWGLV